MDRILRERDKIHSHSSAAECDILKRTVCVCVWPRHFGRLRRSQWNTNRARKQQEHNQTSRMSSRQWKLEVSLIIVLYGNVSVEQELQTKWWNNRELKAQSWNECYSLKAHSIDLDRVQRGQTLINDILYEVYEFSGCRINATFNSRFFWMCFRELCRELHPLRLKQIIL